MELYTLYVGQGDLAVVVGDDEAIIIDANIPPTTDTAAPFIKRALSEILADKKLVGMMLTGFDADHADPVGVSWILGRYQPHWVMYPGGFYKDTAAADAVIARIREGEKKSGLVPIKVRLDELGDKRTFTGLAEQWDVEVFSPHPDGGSSSNNASLVARVTPKSRRAGFSLLVTGDTEVDRWEQIAEIFGDSISCEVMQAPHHGSHTGVCEEALCLVAPDCMLISAGIDNMHGHPHDETLEVYEKLGITYASTHEGDSWITYLNSDGELVTEPWEAS